MIVVGSFGQLPVGLYFFSCYNPAIMGFYVGIICLVILFAFLFIVFMAVRKREQAVKRIMQEGIQAEAVILKAEHTGGVVNGVNFNIRFLLEVRPKDKPAYQASAIALVPAVNLPKYQPGTIVQVKYDPNEPKKVLIIPGDT